MAKLETLVEGIAFGEGPRWRGDRLWFSDIADHRVKSISEKGELRVEQELGARRPSGLGWLPDGRLVVVSMNEHALLRREANGELVAVADLTRWCGGHANDMVVDDRGRAYIGNIGFDLEAKPLQIRPTHIVCVDPDGRARSVAEKVMCPNGMVIAQDRKRLIAGESAGGCLTAFDIEADGSLANRRVFAALPQGVAADGICIDAEDAVWVASPMSKEFLRVHEGGRVSERISCEPHHAIACMLGGADRKTLFAITAGTTQISVAERPGPRTGRIQVARVGVAGAGLP
jgi:sugar lactone lactonase YvrE